MNTNAFHNFLNVLIALVAFVTTILIATGCTALPNGTLECSQSWINPVWTSAIVAGMGILKSVINIARDGFAGLVKRQPPVE